ncbi:hypothetical protein [Niallia sp. 03133]|uniref:hypothetical protein n=1 Tax=Niallia sp. 03133 TaxID=3458060 RepID=UPI004044F821
MKDKKEITQPLGMGSLYESNNIFFNEDNSKLYVNDREGMESFSIKNGVIQSYSRPNYENNNILGVSGKFSLDG